MSFTAGKYLIQFNPFIVFGGLTLFVLLIFIVVFPIVKILHRAGYSGWWILLFVLVPGGNVIGLWCFAYARWPAVQPVDRHQAAQQ
jgi:hypothetical protein